MERRLEYDKGPSLEDDEPANDRDDDEPSPSIGLEGVPWKVSSVAGVGAFAAVYAVAFQLVNAVYGFSPPENELEIGRATAAGLLTLGSHGATIDPAMDWFRYGLQVLLLFAPLLVALTALVVLIGTGYAVTRYVGPDSLGETVATAACVVPGYFLAAVLTARVATHTPELPDDARSSAQEEIGTLAVSVDATFVLVFVLVPLTAALVGALVANRSLLCGSDVEERPADEETAPSDASTDAEGASASPPGRETRRG